MAPLSTFLVKGTFSFLVKGTSGGGEIRGYGELCGEGGEGVYKKEEEESVKRKKKILQSLSNI